MKLSKSQHEVSLEAFSEVVRAIERDMPTVMHGSGDVHSSAVNRKSVRLLSELTASYIANLVGAAVDAHELLNDGPQPLPPPPLPIHRKTTTPRPYEPKPDPKESTGKGSNSASTKIPEMVHRKRRRATDEFWDEPLPEPKIKNKSKKGTETAGPKYQGVPVDEWVGVSGVDFFESNRARNAHVSMPSAIGTRSFIFPVCHDVGLYGKVKEVQAARRNLAPLLADPVIQDVIRTEGALQGPGALRKREKKRTGDSEEEEPEDTDSEAEDGRGAAFPGLSSLLPVHTTADFL